MKKFNISSLEKKFNNIDNIQNNINNIPTYDDDEKKNEMVVLRINDKNDN